MNMNFTVTSAGLSNPLTYPAIAVYSSCADESLISYSDALSQSHVTLNNIPIENGESLFIRVGAISGNEGDFSMTITGSYSL
jgi:hypothetical protein